MLYNLVQLYFWGDIDFDFFLNVIDVIFVSEKMFVILNVDFIDKEKYDDKFFMNIINILQVVCIFFNVKIDDWIQKNMVFV